MSRLNRQDLLDRLHLDDNTVVDQQVEPVTKLDTNAVTVHGKQLLLFASQSGAYQFMDQACLGGTFEQARTEPGVHLVRSGRDVVRRLTMNESVNSVAHGVLRVLRGEAFVARQIEGHV